MLHVAEDDVTVELARRTFTPVLLQAGFAQIAPPIPGWGDRALRFRFCWDADGNGLSGRLLE
jgi:hypothetical protein